MKTGKGTEVPLLATVTKSERQTPNAETTLVPPEHVAFVQVPCFNTVPSAAHPKHILLPAPAQLEQLESHAAHFPLASIN